MRQTSGELKALETKLQGKKELQRQVLAYAQTKPARDGLKAQKSEKARAAYRPVSYTHLDVYKRQVYRHTVLIWPFTPTGRAYALQS